MDIKDIKAIINEVHESLYDWCVSESKYNMAFSDLMRAGNHVLSEINNKIDNFSKIQEAK